MTEREVTLFAEGLEIGEKKPTAPAILEILHSAEQSEIRVTITEGKFHQIKRMFHAVGMGSALSETAFHGNVTAG